MAKKVIDKTPRKRAEWVARTAKALGITDEKATELLRTKRKQSLRLNPLKSNTSEMLEGLRDLGWIGKQYEWCSDGYTIDTPMEPVRDSELVVDGKVFIQNAASWLPVLALYPRPGDTILDICAAPGGKTSHIAALTRNEAHIWANDNSRPRLAKLQANMRRLDAKVDEYTLFDATALARKLEGQQFDKILLDAPCSGEGLMNLDRDKDLATWSVAHIKRLQQMQKKIITQAWQLLKPGGTLVYSTCTMAPEENEAVIDYLLRSQEDAEITPLEVELPNRVPTVKSWNDKAYAPEVAHAMRLIPSEHIEAFFVARIKKVGNS